MNREQDHTDVPVVFDETALATSDLHTAYAEGLATYINKSEPRMNKKALRRLKVEIAQRVQKRLTAFLTADRNSQRYAAPCARDKFVSHPRITRRPPLKIFSGMEEEAKAS